MSAWVGWERPRKVWHRLVDVSLSIRPEAQLAEAEDPPERWRLQSTECEEWSHVAALCSFRVDRLLPLLLLPPWETRLCISSLWTWAHKSHTACGFYVFRELWLRQLHQHCSLWPQTVKKLKNTIKNICFQILFILYFICMRILPKLCLCAMFMCGAHGVQKRGLDPLGLSYDGYELPCECWE